MTVYGLNDKIGNITYYDSSGQSDYTFNNPYSEKTAQVIDEEISRIIEEQYQRAIQILTEHKSELTVLAELLMEKEVIFEDDLKRIFGGRPFAIEEEHLVSSHSNVEEKETDEKSESESEISAENIK